MPAFHTLYCNLFTLIQLYCAPSALWKYFIPKMLFFLSTLRRVKQIKWRANLLFLTPTFQFQLAWHFSPVSFHVNYTCSEKPSGSCNITQESAFTIPCAFVLSTQLISSYFFGLINRNLLNLYVSKLSIRRITCTIICGSLSWFFASSNLSSEYSFFWGHFWWSIGKSQNNIKDLN